MKNSNLDVTIKGGAGLSTFTLRFRMPGHKEKSMAIKGYPWRSDLISLGKIVKGPKEADNYTDKYNEIRMKAEEYLKSYPNSSPAEIVQFLKSGGSEQKAYSRTGSFIQTYKEQINEDTGVLYGKEATDGRNTSINHMIRFFASGTIKHVEPTVDFYYSWCSNKELYNQEIDGREYRLIDDLPAIAFTYGDENIFRLHELFDRWIYKNGVKGASAFERTSRHFSEALKALQKRNKIQPGEHFYDSKVKGGFKFEPKSVAGKLALTQDSIDKIMKADLPNDQYISRRYWALKFLQFQIETGISFADMINIKRHNPLAIAEKPKANMPIEKRFTIVEKIEGNMVMWGFRKKTGVMFIQKLSEKAVEILLEVQERETSNHIQEQYPFRRYINSASYTKAIQGACEALEVNQVVTSKSGRHTFITKLRRYPSTVKNIMYGHSGGKETRIAEKHYIQEVVDEAVKFEEFIYNLSNEQLEQFSKFY